MDTGFGSPAGQPVSLTFSPIPTMLDETMPPMLLFSIRMPQIFLSPVQMSFGHLMRLPMPLESRWSRIASVVICVTSTASELPRVTGNPSPNLRRMLNVRLVAGDENQLWSPCPRPAVCSLAAITDKLSSSPMRLLSSLLVDSVLSTHIIPPPA